MAHTSGVSNSPRPFMFNHTSPAFGSRYSATDKGEGQKHRIRSMSTTAAQKQNRHRRSLSNASSSSVTSRDFEAILAPLRNFQTRRRSGTTGSSPVTRAPTSPARSAPVPRHRASISLDGVQDSMEGIQEELQKLRQSIKTTLRRASRDSNRSGIGPLPKFNKNNSVPRGSRPPTTKTSGCSLQGATTLQNWASKSDTLEDFNDNRSEGSLHSTRSAPAPHYNWKHSNLRKRERTTTNLTDFNHIPSTLFPPKSPPPKIIFAKKPRKPKLGDHVLLDDGRPGTIRYIGHTKFARGEWLGVELHGGGGKHDGEVKGRRYFKCPRKSGVFVPRKRIKNLITVTNSSNRRNRWQYPQAHYKQSPTTGNLVLRSYSAPTNQIAGAEYPFWDATGSMRSMRSTVASRDGGQSPSTLELDTITDLTSHEHQVENPEQFEAFQENNPELAAAITSIQMNRYYVHASLPELLQPQAVSKRRSTLPANAGSAATAQQKSTTTTTSTNSPGRRAPPPGPPPGSPPSAMNVRNRMPTHRTRPSIVSIYDIDLSSARIDDYEQNFADNVSVASSIDWSAVDDWSPATPVAGAVEDPRSQVRGTSPTHKRKSSFKPTGMEFGAKVPIFEQSPKSFASSGPPVTHSVSAPVQAAQRSTTPSRTRTHSFDRGPAIGTKYKISKGGTRTQPGVIMAGPLQNVPEGSENSESPATSTTTSTANAAAVQTQVIMEQLDGDSAWQPKELNEFTITHEEAVKFRACEENHNTTYVAQSPFTPPDPGLLHSLLDEWEAHQQLNPQDKQESK